MKVNLVKSIFAVAFSALIGILCYAIAGEEASRNWISFAVTTVSCTLCLGAAIACDYDCGLRNGNIKVLAWLGTVAVTIANIIFSCCSYNPLTYIAVVALLALLVIAGVYGLYKPKTE